ncbi:type-F conjugative transfer system pilin assembly protein TrbC [Salmonella enterica]|nr:type-F conjugative transfer system pilin assembly protein TrbC [Salmonella enterica]EIK2562350.1 type-F conjugative transfer system pilin assembly protein TrbC [Salmonella enterica]EKA6272942.1 type-F conjugative transfer system pilin assembly protein TrbC [Salmonella enterica]EKO2289578.1 type-F conjugative transfer system pilin assembly protein TrbC [Salmonella enterica]EKT6751942.1 type-F conjugative transfer system pilin assembly protein TrbC [Salmonella enterica]
MKNVLLILLGALCVMPVQADEHAQNRQFLKEQENLSQQRRNNPDRPLQSWAEQQVKNNPLTQSDRGVLDDLVQKQQATGKERAREGAFYFVSFSIPEEGLRRMLGETRRYGIPATLRGMVDNDLKTTADAVLSLVKDGVTEGVQIDPTLFTEYGIRSVPALVVFCSQGYDVIRGNLRVKVALEKIATSGDCQQVAQTLLQQSAPVSAVENGPWGKKATKPEYQDKN